MFRVSKNGFSVGSFQYLRSDHTVSTAVFSVRILQVSEYTSALGQVKDCTLF